MTFSSVTLPSITRGSSPSRTLANGEVLNPIGCYVSPITRQPHGSLGLPVLEACAMSQSSSASSPTRSGFGLSQSSPMHASSKKVSPLRELERYASPTGFNRPTPIPTNIRTVRRMFHHASPGDRQAFYNAFLDRPLPK
eukprot:CAMPEP_0176422776 /NCGR_PEP_ID=MMETSP0127-20121128/9921_1 /TAXON_ID=938130 /ORGANISM="Platyophrya macrostoma, Strain WH" /LENGTH=138 /DNA_ID=CAMNT_0017803663 /DNA_START=68 /DNA_END=484 /DNA_ORIENTATION=+